MASAESSMPGLNDQESKTYVMCVGPAGAGKSSLINSLIKLYDSGDTSQDKRERYIPTAQAELMGGHTMMREEVKLTDDVTIMDNRGWHDWENKAALEELVAQIHGERSLEDDVEWEEMKAASPVPLVVSPKVNCVTIVINGKGGIQGIGGIDNLIETCRKNVRRRPSVVITHKDMLSEDEIKVIKADLVRHAIEPGRIFVIKNITSENENLEPESEAVLRSLITCCVGDGKIGSQFHQKREQNKKLEKKNEEEVKEYEKAAEVERKEKEVEDAKHAVEVAKSEEAMVQLQIGTDMDKQRAKSQREDLESEREHKEKLRDLEIDKQTKVNKIRVEIAELERKHGEQYLKDHYAKKLNNFDQSNK